MELIVPYDRWSPDVADLQGEFSDARFHVIDDLGVAARAQIPAHAHRLYDRRRAVGLALARGRVVALTEDHAVPATDWCRQILAAHEQPHAVIGGAIENGVDRPLNWAWYYCDFGRYGRPLAAGPVEYVSDVNVAYKRSALESVREVWQEAYHETTVHWTLRSRGAAIVLDPRMVVYQHRPAMRIADAYRERMQWGRVFAETRAATQGPWKRLGYAVATPVLPAVMKMRVLRHMLRQGRTAAQIARTLPLAFLLLTGWALGELSGYVAGGPS